jgi:hypothetical protein
VVRSCAPDDRHRQGAEIHYALIARAGETAEGHALEAMLAAVLML